MVDALDCPDLARALTKQGFTHLVVQAGDHARPLRVLERTCARGVSCEVDLGRGARIGLEERERGGERIEADVDGEARKPRPLTPCRLLRLPCGLTALCFAYAPSLAPLLAEASLVVSHAGAGSAFETLGLGVTLVVVPNPRLMDDHQAELAGKLERMGVAHAARVHQLKEVVAAGVGRASAQYEPGDAGGIVRAVDELMGLV
ncbi:hypothetical protein H632_c546p2 [Helicosporidium sp. ATCC 50920]|nr:hypothetical protein H632_c546p2 [Helicosporidium sp. ATCC 50920]|eukprot:KDD75693.1 hypothetical protein H632_c546p2 [Helicosporidium sp. ATCC 50920]